MKNVWEMVTDHIDQLQRDTTSVQMNLKILRDAVRFQLPKTPPVFDPSKPVQTRDGRAARILCTDLKRAGDGDAAEGGGDARTMVVALMGTHDSSHGEYVHLYTPDGCYYASKEPHRDDIINTPERPQ